MASLPLYGVQSGRKLWSLSPMLLHSNLSGIRKPTRCSHELDLATIYHLLGATYALTRPYYNGNQ